MRLHFRGTERVTLLFQLLVQQVGICDALYQKPEHRQTLTRIHLLRIFRNYILDLSVLASLNMSKSFNDLNLSGIFLKFPKSLKFFMGGYVYLGVT